jgi:hypothetical protein
MAASPFQHDIEVASQILAEWNSIVEVLSSLEGPTRETFDLENAIPNLQPSTSIKRLETKLSGVVTLVHNLSNVPSVELIPDAVVNEISTRVVALKAIVGKLVEQVGGVDLDSKIVSLDAVAMTAANEKGQSINLAPTFLELYPAIQTLLSALYQIRAMAGINETHGIGLQLSQIDAARSAQRRGYGELNRLRRATNEARRQLDEALQTAKLATSEIEAIKARASQSRDDIEAKNNQSIELNEITKGIHTQAEQLKSVVNGYQDSFDAFQKQLDWRNEQFAKGQAEQAKILNEMIDIRKETQRLQDRSREVLGEATMTGLTESFAREMNSAKWQLFRMQVLFFFSVVFLLASAGVVLNAFPWLETWIRPIRLEPPSNATPYTMGLFHFVNLLNKAILLVPALFLLGFAAKRYAEVFRIKTLYTYKYTIAASLPGFKIEAPAHAEAITAAAFKELLVNPRDTDISQKEKAPKEENSFLERFLEPSIKKALEKMVEGPKTS